MALHIGMLLFPRLTQLDLTGPYELFHRIPGAEVHMLWKTLDPVRTEAGFGLLPDTTLADCPPLDVVFVPGGFGQVDLMDDDEVLGFLRRQGANAKYVTSVCTGALVLGQAGLLDGYEATTHWAYVDLLPRFGAKPAKGRVVRDRNRITAGGVTAGIDFGLTMVAEIAGEPAARAIQLGLEYDPAPPFDGGHPDKADPALVDAIRTRLRNRLEQDTKERAAKR
ncbi:MAG: DJ-1/PfpI family protein [Myxococcales bacterium]|nr:DJ-1/PfpI family protein [Myxococcales bacterium]